MLIDRILVPLLVSFNSTVEVGNVLSKCGTLSSQIVIKPDLSPKERKIESILFYERWKLLELGNDCSSIKVRSSSLYLHECMVCCRVRLSTLSINLIIL